MQTLDNKFAFRRTWGPDINYPNVIRYNPPSNDFTVISGPCSVENKDQINSIAKLVKSEGATHLRGGVFRAGTYPGKSFGYVEQFLIESFKMASVKNGLQNIIEVLEGRSAKSQVNK